MDTFCNSLRLSTNFSHIPTLSIDIAVHNPEAFSDIKAASLELASPKDPTEKTGTFKFFATVMRCQK